MPLLDIFCVIVIIFFAIRGLYNGFFNELFGLAGLLVSVFLAINSYRLLGGLLNGLTGLAPELANIIGFVVIFLVVLGFFVFVGRMLSKAIRAMRLTVLNRAAGGIFGTIKGGFFLGVLLSVIHIYTGATTLRRVIEQSALADKLMVFSAYVLELFHVGSGTAV